MIALYGFPFSNYHNIVKHALMHKGIDFKEVIAYPGSAELNAVSPVGKVPAMTTDSGTPLSEASVMLEYLEEQYPDQPLLPAGTEARAKVRQIMRVSELYLELPARRLLPAVLGNIALPDSTLTEVRSVLDRGARGLTELAEFAPYIAGSELTLADIYLRYALAIPRMAGPSQLDWDVMSAVPGLSAWSDMMADSDIARKIDADQAANTDEFMAFVASVSR